MRSKLLAVIPSIGALAIGACGTGAPKTGSSESVVRSTSQITLEANGTGKALITYGSGNTGIKQETVLFPWSTYQTSKPTDGITLRVHLNGTGLAQCKITVNGEVRVSNQARGTSAIATCATHG